MAGGRLTDGPKAACFFSPGANGGSRFMGWKDLETHGAGSADTLLWNWKFL